MKTMEAPPEVRMEIVTATFVAAGLPAEIEDLSHVLEQFNRPAGSSLIELSDACVRPLYRSGLPLELESPMLVRRDEVIFANFEGPDLMRGAIRPPEVAEPVLLLAPPFQIQGILMMPPKTDAMRALRDGLQTFFLVRRANVFDAEGNLLGEGEQIIVNGSAVVMTSLTRQHIPAIEEPTVRRHTDVMPDEGAETEELQTFRAA